ncbi:MAG TPA: M48 family metallopeptidase [Chitinophagaceae bacterium]|nr:M48 family metallopeptidase [Chitinophagaceae bacterium]
MRSWFGIWTASLHEDPREVTVLATESDITIGYRLENGTVETRKWALDELKARFEPATQSTRIVHFQEPHAVLLIEGKDALQFISQAIAERQKPWHKKRGARDWARGISIFVAVMAILVSIYFMVVPWAAERMSKSISISTEEQFGNAVYDALLVSARDDRGSGELLNEFFRAMKIETPYNIRLTVVDSDIVNAFALPGGHIVVYTGLLDQLQSYPELAALLSHEFTHVNNKHATRSIFRQLGSRIFLGLLLGNFGSVTTVLIDQAERFKSLKYSRSLEKEADMEGLAILVARKIDPAGFSALFSRLKNAAGEQALPEFLASHPDIDNRIAYIREAVKNSLVEENIELKNIFDKIKQLQ